MSLKLTKSNFEEIVTNSKLPILIDFYADWCGPCKMAAPIIEELATELDGKAIICKLNVDEDEEIAQSFQVASIPTFIVIKDGVLITKVAGLKDKKSLKEMLSL